MKMENEEAVSPVIGVILMVAITVILAAVIAAFVFGMAGTSTTTKNVGLQVTTTAGSTTSLDIMFNGGSDLNGLAGFTINRAGAAITGTPTGAGKVGTGAEVVPTAATNLFVVGDIVHDDLGAGNTIAGQRITIIGRFQDGASQILYDRTM